MKKFLKRALTLLMTLLLLIPMISLSAPARAGGSYTYSPQSSPYYVMNAKMVDSGTFYNTYVKTDGRFNIVGPFFGSGLSYSMPAQVRRTLNVPIDLAVEFPVLDQLRKDGQLSANLSATFKNDFNSTLYNWLGYEFTARAQLSLYQQSMSPQGQTYIDGLDIQLLDPTKGKTSSSLGNGDFYPLSSTSGTVCFDARFFDDGQGSKYLNPSFEKPAMAIADTVAPTIKDIYTTSGADPTSAKTTNFKKGDTVYFQVQFSEYIRFSDDNAADYSGLQLGVKMASLASGQTVDTPVGASFIGLQDRYMTFAYTVPDGMNNFVAGYIGITDGSGADCLNGGDNAYPLTLAADLIITQADLSLYGLTGSTSLVTDLAGNPASVTRNALGYVFSPTTKSFLDTVPPTVASVSMDVYSYSGQLISGAVQNGDTVNSYIGPGCHIELNATFSEELGNIANNHSNFTATLNITDTSTGLPVTVTGFNSQKVSTVNGVDKTQILFDDALVQPSWVMPDGEYIKIVSLTYNGGPMITDLRGNAYDSNDPNSPIPDPDKRFYVDTTAPTVTTTCAYDSVNNVYTPEENSGSTGFIFPFTMSDDGPNASGVGGIGATTLIGKFYLEADGNQYQSFKYYVGPSAATPDDSQLLNGGTMGGPTDHSNAFIQISSGQMYLHVIFPDSVDPSYLQNARLRFVITDNAGNESDYNAVFPLDNDIMQQVTDRAGPTFTLTDETTDPAAETMTINATVTDPSLVSAASIQYAFSDIWVDPSDPSNLSSLSWTSCDASMTDPDTDIGTINLTLTKALENTQNSFYLYLTAQDCSPKNNVSYSQGFYFYADLSAPGYGLRVNEGLCDIPMLSMPNINDPTGNNKPSAAFFVISDNNNFNGDCYFTMYDDTLSAGNTASIFSQNLTWYKGTLTDDGNGGYSITGAAQAGAGDLPALLKSGIYYGNLYAKALIGYTDDNGGLDIDTSTGIGTLSFDAGLTAERGTWSFQCAGTQSNVHSIDISMVNPPDATSSSWTPDTSAQNCLPTLNGQSFKVDIANSLMPGWGLADVEMSASYIAVSRNQNTDPASDTGLVYYSTLDGAGGGSNIYFTVNAPADSYDQQATYYVTVVLVPKVGNLANLESAKYTIPIQVSPLVPDAGISRISSVINSNVSGVTFPESDTWYGYGLNESGSQTSYTSPGPITLATYADGNVSQTQYISFTSNNTYYSVGTLTNDKAFVKVWNATTPALDSAGQAAAKWTQATYSSTDAEYLFDVVPAADAAAYGYGGLSVPVIAGEQNIIAYEFMYENGTGSGVRTISVATDDMAPAFDVTLDTPSGGAPAASATARVSIAPQDAIDATAYCYDTNVNTAIGGGPCFELPDGTYQLTQDSVYWFYVTDAAGNFSLMSVEPNFTIDSTPPDLSGNGSASDSMFTLTYIVTDSDAANGFTAYLNYDDAYAQRLGLTLPQAFDIPAMPDGTYTWVASSPVTHGIYEIDVSYSGGDNYTLTMHGAYKYNADASAPQTEGITATLYVRDRAGNVSEQVTTNTMTLANTAPGVADFGVSNVVAANNYQWIDGYHALGTWAKFTEPVANVLPFSALPAGGLDSYMGASMINGYADYTGSAGYDPTLKVQLGVYQGGSCDISFTDVFGTTYTQTVTFPASDFDDTGYQNSNGYNYGLDITSGQPDPDTGLITMTVAAVDSRVKFDIWQGTSYVPTDGSLYGSTGCLASFTNSATVPIDPSRNVYIVPYDMGRIDVVHSYGYFGPVMIQSADSTKLQVSVKWYYDETASDQAPAGDTTTGSVRAFLSSNRALTGINGTDTAFTFTYGGPDSYTFEYTDALGNTGSLTATLSPMKIALPDPDAGDKDAPLYNMTIYGQVAGATYNYDSYSNYNNSYSAADAVDPGSLSDAFAPLPWAQGYLLNFALYDASPARIIVLAPGTGSYDFNTANDTITGVTVRGNQIVVMDETAAFDVVLIDQQNNASILSFDSGMWKIDFTPPTADVQYVPTDFNVVTAYVLLSDSQSGGATLLYPSGLAPEASGTYAGYYAIKVTENTKDTPIDLRFTDAVGNQGTYTLTVDSLDTTVPVVTGVTWSPFFISALDGSGDPSLPPDRPVNTNVTATVKFNEIIKEITVTDAQGNNAPAGVTVSPALSSTSVDSNDPSKMVTYSSVVITFDETFDSGAQQPLTLNFTAQNGKTGYPAATLYIGGATIDKTAPTATAVVTNDAPNSTTATVTITPVGKDMYIGKDGKVYGPQSPLVVTETERGEYTWQLVDIAGNIAKVTASIQNIDDTDPLILLNNLPDTGAWVKGSLTFQATMDRAGAISMGGVDHPFAAPAASAYDANGKIDPTSPNCVFIPLTITQNGNYAVTGTDAAGRSTTTYLSINCIDNTPPRLVFKTPTVAVIQDSDVPTALALLTNTNDYSTSDNASGVKDVTLSAADQANLSMYLATPGAYTLTYTVTDNALPTGNSADFTRLLKVLSLTDVAVTLNGVMTYSGDTAIVTGTPITMDVKNLPGGPGEPYKTYIRAGRWTAAQMKTGSTMLTSDTFTVNSNVVYTLYIITQSRGTYLTYFYAQ